MPAFDQASTLATPDAAHLEQAYRALERALFSRRWREPEGATNALALEAARLANQLADLYAGAGMRREAVGYVTEALWFRCQALGPTGAADAEAFATRLTHLSARAARALGDTGDQV